MKRRAPRRNGNDPAKYSPVLSTTVNKVVTIEICCRLGPPLRHIEYVHKKHEDYVKMKYPVIGEQPYRNYPDSRSNYCH